MVRTTAPAIGYNFAVRFRAGLLVGFGVGYWFGAKAGRERYLQLEHRLDRLKRTDMYQQVSAKARAAVNDGVDRARDRIEEVALDKLRTIDLRSDDQPETPYDQDLDI